MSDASHPPVGPDALGGSSLRSSAHRASTPLRRQVFDCVRAQGRMARADVARTLGISAATVTVLTADLIAMGLLREREDVALEGREGSRGRRPVALEIVPEAMTVIGVKLGADRHTAILADFTGSIVVEASRPALQGPRPPAELISEVETIVDELGDAARAARTVGVGLSGLIDHQSGAVGWSPLLADSSPDFAQACGSRLGRRVQVDNDVNARALAELWFGAGRSVANFALVTIEHGVGLGLVQDGRLIRGAHGMGLGLGHTKVHLDGALCRCGRRGCLDAYVADYVLVREAATALRRDLGHFESPRAAFEALHDAATAGHEAAREVFVRAGRYVALGLSNIVQLFDPDMVILLGDAMRFEFLGADKVLDEMRRLALPGSRPPRIEVHDRGDLAWAQGAAVLAIVSATDEALGA